MSFTANKYFVGFAHLLKFVMAHSSSSNYDSDSSSDEDFGHMVLIKRKRIFKQRINFIDGFSDFVFKEKFRLSHSAVEYIIHKIGGNLQHETRRNKALQPLEQVLCTLHWLGSGAQYHLDADAHGLSKATVHHCIKRVCSAIVETLLGEEVRWPTRTVEEIPQLFMRVANIPRIAGIVDGSLIKLDAPRENEAAFVDRYGNHSINIMVVCGPNLEFFYANARWPGSVHDARVMRCSSLAQQWDNGWRPFPNAILLGDSGYGCTKWLISPNIPIQIPRTESLERYLRAFRSTRRMVENSLGILKEKLPCLNHLRLQPVPACKVILACIILHNIQKRLGSEMYEPYQNGDDFTNYGETETVEEGVDQDGESNPEAIEVLRELIQIFER